MTFNDFALRPEILRAVEEAGYVQPTPIQEKAIPIILEGKDLLGIAQTGTGKTAAFVLPMIERLAMGQAKARMPRSLILSPVRELATQTAAYFETYGKYLKLTQALLIGGVSLDEQSKKLERGVDVLIATPGRLIDQFERGRVLLGGITILVIDEADRMLDMGFIPDVERIVRLLTRRQQTMMFSATMPAEVRRLANTFLDHPEEVQASPPATSAENVTDHLMVVPPRQKFKALQRLIDTLDVDKAIIFCNRKREVASLRKQLERAGRNVRDIHGDLDQSQRTQALEAFKRGEIDFLVATDVAARGLDIAMLPCVINYDVPTHPDDYVHRIGRTGRAGKEGRAFTLALPEEGRLVGAITRLTGRPIPRLPLRGFEDEALVDEPKGRGRRGRVTAADPVSEAGSARPVEVETVAEAAQAEPAARSRRRRRPVADPGPEAGPVEPAAAPPEAEAAPGERRQPRRSRRPAEAPGPDVEARGPDVEAGGPSAPEVNGTESADAAAEAAGGEAAPAEVAPAEVAPPETGRRGERPGRARGERQRQPARRAGAQDRQGEQREPVVGMGDHV
ncbi:MAG TPA: DEAD/DEAH box helicase, partial [Geminicoccaceae bacterium]